MGSIPAEGVREILCQSIDVGSLLLQSYNYVHKRKIKEGNKEMQTAKKKVKEDLKIVSSERKYKRGEDGSIVINMNVKDDTDFLSVFSESNVPVISSEVAEFIENSSFSVMPKEKLTLKIYSDCIDDEEKVIYRKAIEEYYTERYIVNERELKRNYIIILVLTLFGVITLIGAYFIDNRTGISFLMEIVDIAAWVFLWEAVDISVFHLRELRVKRRRYLSFLTMNIEYFPYEENRGCSSSKC